MKEVLVRILVDAEDEGLAEGLVTLGLRKAEWPDAVTTAEILDVADYVEPEEVEA